LLCEHRVAKNDYKSFYFHILEMETNPDDIIKFIFDYVKDDESVISTNTVCRKWQSSPVMKHERYLYHQRMLMQRVFAEMTECEYPERIRRIFTECNKSIWKLPILDLGDRRGATSYIDFIQNEEMTAPIMRFKDVHNRPGIAFLIQVGNYHGVLAIFQRYSDTRKRWSMGWGNSDMTIEAWYNRRHDDEHGPSLMACPACPFVDMQPSDAVIRELLEHNCIVDIASRE
jgi:hypothetical protein